MKWVKEFLEYPEWRGAVSECPHCRKDFPNRTFKIWFASERIVEVVTDPSVRMGKSGSLMVASECPVCYAVSWQHMGLDHSYWLEDFGWSKADISRYCSERRRRLRNGKARWRKSLCFSCTRPRTVEWDCLYAYVNCSVRMGPASSRRRGCEHFLPSKGDR